MFEDKTLVCRDCGEEFIFSAGEQEFYAEKGFQNEPTRCRNCRKARKAARSEAEAQPTTERVRYAIVCANCGANDHVPFIPKTDRPLLCSKCMAEKKAQMRF